MSVLDFFRSAPQAERLPLNSIQSEPVPVAVAEAPGPPTIDVADLPVSAYAGQTVQDPFQNSLYDGGKFFGGFGPTQLFTMDYPTLRARSIQLFTENLYAKGLIRRLITNEISTGLTPEPLPVGSVIDKDDDELTEFSTTVKSRFGLWSRSAITCDYLQADTFAALQRKVRREALIAGDVLVVLRYNKRTRLPMIQLVNASLVQTPTLDNTSLSTKNKILHGVETDSRGRVVAYHIRQENGKHKRLPAFGERSGRRISWLVFGTDKRMGEVRGTPLLGIILQSLKEIDRYRDSAQRKAVINSMIAMFIKKTEDKMGSDPFGASAVRKDAVTVTDGDGTTRDYNVQNNMPGTVFKELQQGEEPVGFQGNTDVDFPTFETAVLRAVAWANEIPPEILELSFGSNYAASQAAINEFKIYLNKVRGEFGEDFCTPIYTEWLLGEALEQRISAPGLVEASRRKSSYDIFGAWTSVTWYGSIKPSTDVKKVAEGAVIQVNHGWSTNARQAREQTGTNFDENMIKLERENKQMVKAYRPIAEFKAEFGELPGSLSLEGKLVGVGAGEDDDDGD